MPVNRHIAMLLAGTAFAALAGTASAQQADGAAPGAPAIGAPSAQPTGVGVGLPSLAPTDPIGDVAIGKTSPGRTAAPATQRVVLRPPKVRRGRGPVQSQVRADFRPTLAPARVAADVQPLQTGLPDISPLPVPVRKRPPIDDPYSPLGLRAGNIVFTPTVGQAFGYDTNPNRLARNKQPSALSQTDLELGIQSDWSRHDLYGQLRGGYSEYFDNPAARRPDGAGNLRLRLDVTRDTEIDVEGHYLIDTQRPSSPDLNAPVVSRPVVYTEGASIVETQRLNRLIVAMRGTIDRTDYEDARLPGGVVIDQRDRAFTQYGLRGRLGYELNPGLIPFVEILADTRQYDRKTDSAGYERSSDGIAVRGGTLFELSRLVTAEVAVGMQSRTYEDKRLGTLTSPIADATLSYALTPLTTIRGTASATVDETAVPGARGIRSVRGTLEVQHALRRNLTLTAGIRASDALYQGVAIEEKGLGAFLRADYRFTRQIALRASYTYDRIQSSVPGISYAANTFLMGIRLTP